MGVVLLVGETGIYVTWVTGAIISSVALMWVFKPPWARITLNGFQDMFRRYWMHGIVVFSIYIWKDLFDGIDRLLMANTRIDMTSYIYAIEGDIVLWFQQTFENQLFQTVELYGTPWSLLEPHGLPTWPRRAPWQGPLGSHRSAVGAQIY